MEKYPVRQSAKLSFGLLIFLAQAVCAFSAGPSRSVMKSLTVKPDSDVFFTAQENGYTLRIPDTMPSAVQTDFTHIPQGVQFVSSRREEYIDSNGGRGTVVRLWFTFTDTGTIKLPPLIAVVAGKTYYIPFEDVTVYENPALISPEASVRFESGLSPHTDKDGVIRLDVNAGDEIVFTVELKYFVQVVAFRWNLPKDSIFVETARYEALQENYADREFSTQPKPLASFSWKPLVPGEYSLPDITIEATAYNGTLKSAVVPLCAIKVLHASGSPSFKNEGKDIAESVFKSAFKENQSSSPSVKGKVLAKQSEELAELRSSERNSFPWSIERRNRRAFENGLGLYKADNEPSRPLAILFLALSIAFAVVSGLLAFFRAFKLSVAPMIAGAVCLVLCVFSFARLVPVMGVFAGGVISSVPEENTSSFLETGGTLRVRIKEKTAGYYYIDSTDASGWVKKELVYEIR